MKFQVWTMIEGKYTQLLDVPAEKVIAWAETAAKKGEPFQFIPM